MRFIKLASISVVVLFLLATAITSLLPSTIIVSRAKDVSISTDSAYGYLSNLDNWKNWLHQQDTGALVVNKSSKEIIYNKTVIRVLSSTPQRITTEWQTGDGEPMKGELNLIPSANTNIITIQWAFTQHVKWYPWEKFASILSDKALGPYMEKSLDNLKQQLEPLQQ